MSTQEPQDLPLFTSMFASTQDRDRVLREINKILRNSEGERGRLFITGNPNSGKTTLMRILHRMMRLNHPVVLTDTMCDYGQTRTRLPSQCVDLNNDDPRPLFFVDISRNTRYLGRVLVNTIQSHVDMSVQTRRHTVWIKVWTAPIVAVFDFNSCGGGIPGVIEMVDLPEVESPDPDFFQKILPEIPWIREAAMAMRCV